jgi:hypothetical protein
MPAKKPAKMVMTKEHKAALAEGRNQGRAVRNYLEALEAHKPKRGRKRTPDSIAKRLDAIETDIPTADPMKRVLLVQEKLDLEAELASSQGKVDLGELEAGFIAAAKGYSERKGISYAAWRAIGVPASVLSSAGITRGSA